MHSCPGVNTCEDEASPLAPSLLTEHATKILIKSTGAVGGYRAGTKNMLECRGVADGGACVSEVLAGGGGGENIRYR